jgi:hypothetical protein
MNILCLHIPLNEELLEEKFQEYLRNLIFDSS